MTRHGLFFGGLALSLAVVASVRQKVDNTVSPVHAIGAFLQERNMGSDELLHQLSEYAALTPGAQGSFVKSLKALAQDIETQVKTKIQDGQKATQGKLDSLFDSLETANAATDTAKKIAVESDQSWFECVAGEQVKRQEAEAAEQSLTNSRSNENEACQRQQDNRGFKFDATGKYKMNFACDHGVSGNCQAALKTWQESVLQKMFADAEGALAKDEKNYNSLEASCDAKKTERVQAQSSLNSAESAWSTKRAKCNKLYSQREAMMCAFGTKAQSKCSAEADYATLAAATKKAQGDADSEVDRESEWVASGTTKCMIEKSMQKGLNSNVDDADLNACTSQVNFAEEVGRLNLKQAEFDELSKTNACAEGEITFSKGLKWNVPTGDKPSSKDYTRTEFAPLLDPSTSNFDFCSAPAPSQDKCDDGWSAHGAACYRAFHQNKSYVDAEAACVKHSGHLASLHNDAEKQFVYSLISKTWMWIGHHGGKACCGTSDWAWTDGSGTHYLRTAPSASSGGLIRDGGDCGVFGPGFRGISPMIGDDDCHEEKGYVCKAEAKAAH